MNIAIIGYGGMGSYHAGLLRAAASEGYNVPRLIGIYDVDPARQAAAKNAGIPVFASPEEMWAAKDLDGVLIATPNDLHAAYAIDAARAKKHVICEKPIALSLQEAEQMYAAAQENGVVFTIHQNRRWDEDFLTVKEIANKGEIGNLSCIESRVTGANGIPGDWRKKAEKGGGMMLDWGVHLIDQALHLFPQAVTEIYAEYSYVYGEEVEDGFTLSLLFEDGTRYRITVATDCFRQLPRWQIYGTEGTATVENWDCAGGITRAAVEKDENLRGIRAGNGLTKTMAPRTDASLHFLSLPHVSPPPYAFYRNFCAACEGKEPLAVKREEVFRVFRVMEAATRSAKAHEVIKERI